jgi:hypothetical protein
MAPRSFVPLAPSFFPERQSALPFCPSELLCEFSAETQLSATPLFAAQPLKGLPPFLGDTGTPRSLAFNSGRISAEGFFFAGSFGRTSPSSSEFLERILLVILSVLK